MKEHDPCIDDLKALRGICLRLRTLFVERLDYEEAMYWRQAADRVKGLLQLGGIVCANDSEAESINTTAETTEKPADRG